MQNQEIVLNAKDICKNFTGVKALKNINITLHRGEVRCLVGENGCGKSTFVKIIAGVEQPTSGKIILNGNEYDKLSSEDAIREGVQVIYQDMSLFEHMTVAENIAIAKIKQEGNPVVSPKKIKKIAKEILDYIGVDIPLELPVREISIANKQIVAICRALVLEARVLFMDEPTTALTKNEIDHLLDIMNGLKEKGIAIVFISHKLDEVIRICDTITVLRDGIKVGEFESGRVDEKTLVYYMTGREVLYNKYHRMENDNEMTLSLRNLSRIPHYSDINIDIRKGDIVGLIGLIGSGRTELALSLFGMNPPDSGEIWVNNEKINIGSPSDAVKAGIALVPEDRMKQGLFLGKAVDENIAAAVLDRMKRKCGNIDKRRMKEVAEDAVKGFSIKTTNIKTLLETLSGGNQQKVVLGKWNATKPQIMILDSPTVGVDVGSKAEIYNYIQKFACEGASIIIITDEIPEVVANCNRVLIMFNGKLIYEISDEQLKQDNISKMISYMVETGETQFEV